MAQDIEIIRSKVMGFCMGVRGVIQKAEEQLSVADGKPVYTYGPLIHNPQVIEDLESRGIKAISSPDEGDGGVLVIRAHGIHPDERAAFSGAGYDLVEGTCPRVLNSQAIVTEYSRKGWFIVIVGDKGHGEVKAIVGCAAACAVILTEKEAREIELPESTLVIAQTTLSGEEYDAICVILKDRNSNIKIVKSICPATRQRQKALSDLTRKVEAVLVIGGKNSANTRRLYLNAVKTGLPSWHIEDEDDLPDVLKNYRVIGITAGASTPGWMIERIEAAVRENRRY